LFVPRKTVATSADVNSWVKQFTTSLSTTFNAQTCPNAVLKSPTTSSILKASSAGRLFEQKFYGLFEHMSLAFESTSLQRQRFFHAQSIRRRLNSYNFDAGLDFDYTTGSKHQKLARFVEQKNHALFEQKNTIQNGLVSRNYCRAVSRIEKI
jgi:hypothetical protein